MTRLAIGSLLVCCVVWIATATAAASDGARAKAASTATVRTLQLADAGFPDLLMRRAGVAIESNGLALACDQIRARRIDELDPVWRRVVQRIHLECEPLPAVEDGEADTMATVVTAYLHQGSARFLDLPVAELRLMDSEFWSDHQYVLDTPYPRIIDTLQPLLVARCQAKYDGPGALGRRDCKVTRTDQGMFIDSSAVGGAWVHPDPYDPKRTVYAEAWAE